MKSGPPTNEFGFKLTGMVRDTLVDLADDYIHLTATELLRYSPSQLRLSAFGAKACISPLKERDLIGQ